MKSSAKWKSRHLKALWISLSPEDSYDAADIPTLGTPEGVGEDFLWEELLDTAREDGSQLSFFIVNEEVGGRESHLYVFAGLA